MVDYGTPSTYVSANDFPWVAIISYPTHSYTDRSQQILHFCALVILVCLSPGYMAMLKHIL